VSRIRIELPHPLPWTTELPVRIGDINYGGHLGNDAVLALIHEARVRFLQALGFSERDVAGAGLIMVDAAIQYRSEAFYNDVLTIGVGIASVHTTGCDLVYRLDCSGREVARAKTGLAFFDYAARRPVRVPEPFAAAAQRMLVSPCAVTVA
jgi:4-hydroxybenzoyl-CoA thioesterase